MNNVRIFADSRKVSIQLKGEISLHKIQETGAVTMNVLETAFAFLTDQNASFNNAVQVVSVH